MALAIWHVCVSDTVPPCTMAMHCGNVLMRLHRSLLPCWRHRFVKALFRGAQAAVKLGRVQQAWDLVQEGLAVEPGQADVGWG